jgi:hypothetical protein
VIGSGFLVLSQWQESRRQKAGAASALLIEVDENANLAQDMIAPAQHKQPFPQAGPNPSFFSRRVWDAQMPLVAQVLSPKALQLLAKTYREADGLVRSRLADGVLSTNAIERTVGRRTLV